MVVLLLPEGMTPEEAMADVKTSINFGNAEIRILWVEGLLDDEVRESSSP